MLRLICLALLMLTVFAGRSEEKINYYDPALSEYVDGEYEKAIGIYKKYLADNTNFLEEHKAVYNYKIAYCHAAMANIDAAYKFLNMAVDSGYDRVEILYDLKLEPLHEDPRWEQIEASVKDAFITANFHIPNVKLAYQLTKMNAKDVLYRNNYGLIELKYGPKSEQIKKAHDNQRKLDEKNLSDLRDILEDGGWPSKNVVGKTASEYAFGIFRHADLEVQKEFLPDIKTAFEKGYITAFDYAVIEDMIALAENGKQVYGTQVHQKEDGSIIIEPIEEERNLDIRRQKIGLEPMADYMIVYGFEYKLPKY